VIDATERVHPWNLESRKECPFLPLADVEKDSSGQKTMQPSFIHPWRTAALTNFLKESGYNPRLCTCKCILGSSNWNSNPKVFHFDFDMNFYILIYLECSCIGFPLEILSWMTPLVRKEQENQALLWAYHTPAYCHVLSAFNHTSLHQINEMNCLLLFPNCPKLSNSLVFKLHFLLLEESVRTSNECNGCMNTAVYMWGKERTSGCSADTKQIRPQCEGIWHV